MTEMLAVDKRKPSYDLKHVQALVAETKIEEPKWTVLESAQDIGFTLEQAYDEILNLELGNFYKSTTEYFNPRVWYDVYKKRIGDTSVYIKFKIVSGTEKFLLSSFKKDTGSKGF